MTHQQNSKNSCSFEQSMQRLEDILAHLNKPDVALNEAVEQFEQGMQLIANCETTLQNAEQVVKKYTPKDNAQLLEDFQVEPNV